MPIFERRVEIPAPAAATFAWHARPGAFERLTPPWEPVRVVERTGGIDTGKLVIETRLGPAKLRWIAQHQDFIPGQQFRDVQVSGPFKRWVHTHRVESLGEQTSRLMDCVDYELPMGSLGHALAGEFVHRKLERLFRYRHAVTAADVASHHRASMVCKPMRVAITGATGLVGRALSAFLSTGGHEVVAVARPGSRYTTASTRTIAWDPDRGVIDAAALEGVDAIVHLAGESIAAGRWNRDKKRRILDSRVRGTDLIARAAAKMNRPPRVLVSASAIGFYGHRGDARLDETSSVGEGFLAEVCRAWESAAAPASSAGVRVVNLRIGIVLTPAGGALARMLTPFALGVGGVIGAGSQFWSWISLDDLIEAIHHSLLHDGVHGPVNAVAPEPATNRDFTHALGGVLRRPTVLPMPASAARLALGEMADELLLASARVGPTRLTETRFQFRHPTLEKALRHALGR